MLCLIELPRTEVALRRIGRPVGANLDSRNCSGQRRRLGLDLGVAVTAQKHAFSCLLAQSLERRSTPSSHVEALRRRIEMMEMKRRRTSVIAADGAATAGLGDQRVAHVLAASRHSLDAAPHAAIGPATLEPELGQTVGAATHLDDP